jgi:hypothetical protein
VGDNTGLGEPSMQQRFKGHCFEDVLVLLVAAAAAAAAAV